MSDQVVLTPRDAVRRPAARCRSGGGSRSLRQGARADVRRAAYVRVLQHSDLQGMERDRGRRAHARAAGDRAVALRPAPGCAERAAVARLGAPRGAGDVGLRVVPAGRGVYPVRLRLAPEPLSTRTLVHSLAGCAFYGAFAAKVMLVHARAGCTRLGHCLSPAVCCC